MSVQYLPSHVFYDYRQSYFETANAVISGRSQWTEVFHGCDTLARTIITCATVGPLAQPLHTTLLLCSGSCRARLPSQDSAGILLTHLLQRKLPCGLRIRFAWLLSPGRRTLSTMLFSYRKRRGAPRWYRGAAAIAKRCWGRAFFVREPRRNCCDTQQRVHRPRVRKSTVHRILHDERLTM